MQAKSFVRDYALSCYSFDNEEDYLIGRLIHKYMRGRRVLDLGCGPVAPVLALFYPNAQEVVAVDRLKENLDFIKNNSGELREIMQRALVYKHGHLYRKDSAAKIKLVMGDVTERLRIGKFDAVMQIGCFGALDTKEQFQKAVNNTYAYLKPHGTLLMVNWLDTNFKVRRPFHFNGNVNSKELYVPCMENAGFDIREIHTTAKLSTETKKLGYSGIVWAVARK
jgi:SAM-dependent methyltransferase